MCSAEFKNSGKWNRNVPIHPEFVPVKETNSQPITQPNITDESKFQIYVVTSSVATKFP